LNELTVVVVNAACVPPPGLDGLTPRICADVTGVVGHEDVVILYARRPGTDAHRLTAGVSSIGLGLERPRLCAIAATLDPLDVIQAFEAGVTSYLVLGEWSGSLAAAVHCTAQDVAVASRSIASFLRTRTEPRRADFGGATLREQLSPRERAIMEKLARGQDTAAIAGDLSLSRQTVRNHLASIFAKLNVHGQSQAILRWLGHDSDR